MPNNQFINLEELDVTTQALLSKINEQANLKVNKTNVSALYDEGTKIAEIEDVDIYAPIQEIDTSNFVTQGDLNTVAYSGSYNDLNNTPNLSSYMVKGTDYVTAGQKSGTTLGYRATTEGYNTAASSTGAHAEGYSTTASGTYSHAEGEVTTASATGAHAEGYYTKASGVYSHAEGAGNIASGYYSHAEGSNNAASGSYSHAEGQQTVAQRRSQHVFGEYNILDTSGTTSTRGTYVEIVGKGSGADYRSNARTLDWSGNEVLAGKLTVGADPTNNMDVVTKQYLTSAINNMNSFNVDIVSGDLPTTGIDAHTIYFKSNSTTGSNVYDEYMYINENWELIGSTAIDLTPYALLTDLPIAEDDEDVEGMLNDFNLDYTTTPGASLNMWTGGNY